MLSSQGVIGIWWGFERLGRCYTLLRGVANGDSCGCRSESERLAQRVVGLAKGSTPTPKLGRGGAVWVAEVGWLSGR